MNLNLEEYDKSEVQLTTLMTALKLIYDEQLEDNSLMIKNNIIFRYDDKRKTFYTCNGCREELSFTAEELAENILLIQPSEKL